jgi:purine-binding chemotaxis protein CheW
MVDIAKIRKKARDGARRAAGGGREGGPPPEDKLEKFLESAGTKRFDHAVAVEAPRDQVELLTFIIGSERYAIDIERIVEIISARPVTRVPNAEPFVTGIISLRGAIVTLVDVRTKLRQAPRNGVADARVIVLDEGGSLIGFEVDRVLRPAKIDRAAIEPQPVLDAAEESEAILGIYRTGDALTIVLDLAKLLGS